MKQTMLSLAAMLAVCSAEAADFQALTQRCEEALALSALPADLRDRADVYVWRNGDFVKSIENGGDFHCVVQRNHPDAIIPECVTQSGKDSMLEAIFVQTKMTASGMSPDEVAERAAEMIESGAIPGPKEAGVNYMMSDYNHIWTANSDAISHIPAHTMFFAPGATNAALGGSFATAIQTPGRPFVAEAGSHSYIITFTASSSDSSDVLQHCAGQFERPANAR